MATGKVKFFNKTKGFGFISEEDSQKDIFVHVTGLIDRIQDNDPVQFDVIEDTRGKKAVEVKIIKN